MVLGIDRPHTHPGSSSSRGGSGSQVRGPFLDDLCKLLFNPAPGWSPEAVRRSRGAGIFSPSPGDERPGWEDGLFKKKNIFLYFAPSINPSFRLPGAQTDTSTFPHVSGTDRALPASVARNAGRGRIGSNGPARSRIPGPWSACECLLRQRPEEQSQAEHDQISLRNSSHGALKTADESICEGSIAAMGRVVIYGRPLRCSLSAGTRVKFDGRVADQPSVCARIANAAR